MDFDQLTTFLEVVKQGNFSRAGDKVFRSQSAVSAQIRQLEQDYGTKLLDRSGKRVALTPAGEVLFEYANRLLALRGESLRAVADQNRTPRGVLAIGANEATCLYVLPETFSEYRRRYSDVQISIYRNFSHKILERLQDGLIDVGIVTMPVKAPRLVVKRIFRDRLMLMTSPNHPLAKMDAVSVEAMADYPIILPKAGHTRKTMDKTLPALPGAIAGCHGTAQHRDDQGVRRFGNGDLAHQRELRPQGVSRRRSPSGPVVGREPFTRAGTGVSSGPHAAALGGRLH